MFKNMLQMRGLENSKPNSASLNIRTKSIYKNERKFLAINAILTVALRARTV